jgi:hypothetical protein
MSVGTDTTKAARELAAIKRRKDAWPYPWVYPPAESIPVNLFGAVAIPATSEQVIIPFAQSTQPDGSYLVPNAMLFVLKAIVWECNGYADFAGDGSVYGTLDVNQPLGGAFPSGAAVKDLQKVTVNLGSLGLGKITPYQWRIDGKQQVIFEPRTVLRWKVLNVSATPGAAVAAAAGLFGFLIPEGV